MNDFNYKVREVFNLKMHYSDLDGRWVINCEIMIEENYEIIPISARVNEITLCGNFTPHLQEDGTIRIGDCNTICFDKAIRFYEEWNMFSAERMEVY